MISPMLFWIIATVLALAIAASLIVPLLRRQEEEEPGGSEDVALYRDQLAEVERDVARGVLDPEEAERARTEIARRLLAADRAGVRPMREAPRSRSMVVAVVAALVLVVGSLTLYGGTAALLRALDYSDEEIATLRDDLTLPVRIGGRGFDLTPIFDGVGAPGFPDQPRAARLAEAEAMRANRISQAEAEAIVATLPRSLPEADPTLLAAVERLRELMPENPDNLTGWELLSLHEAQLGNYAAAAAAQAEVIALRGEDVTAGDLTALLDRMVAAARGHVSPEADEVIERIEALDPGNLAARYYAGLMHLQTGRPDLTFGLWRTVLEQAPAGSLHRRMALAQIDDVSFLAGRDYTPPPAPAERGPSAEDIAAAADLDPEVRDQMIRGMVAQLAERLAVQGGSAEDWAQLISAYAVLGEIETAGSIWAEAQMAFAASEESMVILTRAALLAGLPVEAPTEGGDDSDAAPAPEGDDEGGDGEAGPEEGGAENATGAGDTAP